VINNINNTGLYDFYIGVFYTNDKYVSIDVAAFIMSSLTIPAICFDHMSSEL
jgi:hypothetical protein